MTSVFNGNSVEMEINKLVSVSNKILNTTNDCSYSTKPAVVEINSKVLSYQERIILHIQIKDIAIQYVTVLHDLGINIYHNWIEDITIDNCVDYFYDLLLNGINMSIARINDILSVKNIVHHYSKTTLMNAVIIYGGSVYFLKKFMQIPLLRKTQSTEKVITICNKIEVEHKLNFYTSFNQLIDDILRYFSCCENYNINLQLLSDDRIPIYWLLIDCCEKIESLDFNTFLV